RATTTTAISTISLHDALPIFTGRAYDGTSDDYATLAYSARTGSQLWVSLYNGPGNGYDLPFAMAVRPDGRAVYVTGNSLGLTSEDRKSTRLNSSHGSISYAVF